MSGFKLSIMIVKIPTMAIGHSSGIRLTTIYQKVIITSPNFPSNYDSFTDQSISISTSIPELVSHIFIFEMHEMTEMKIFQLRHSHCLSLFLN